MYIAMYGKMIIMLLTTFTLSYAAALILFKYRLIEIHHFCSLLLFWQLLEGHSTLESS